MRRVLPPPHQLYPTNRLLTPLFAILSPGSLPTGYTLSPAPLQRRNLLCYSADDASRPARHCPTTPLIMPHSKLNILFGRSTWTVAVWVWHRDIVDGMNGSVYASSLLSERFPSTPTFRFPHAPHTWPPFTVPHSILSGPFRPIWTPILHYHVTPDAFA